MKIYKPKADYKALLEDMCEKLRAEAEEQKEISANLEYEAEWVDLTVLSVGESLYANWLREVSRIRGKIAEIRDKQAGEITKLLQAWDMSPEEEKDVL